ncbi:Tetratricopeptide repeat protein [Stieleria maiorica]|uniref:Tetratricopeptide repeat protein n=1 Tax=Stieleria maiorica TaxID=2795974 RepID=A0A5B9M8F8_9BACT|nr:multiheme c-type cytochrome [Stieleria maiorica]QEF97451.1 Tetratricopeptide repeat protein [Stieleria maiorica]
MSDRRQQSSSRPNSVGQATQNAATGGPTPPANPKPLKQPSRRWLIVAAALGTLIAGGVFADYWSAEPAGAPRRYVGRDACIDCHREQTESFLGSDHDKAMDLATDETVLGDFNDVTFEHDGLVNRLYRDGKRFMVHTEGEDGTMQDFEVKYVFGVYPLQQYMVEFDRSDDMPECDVARLQVLRISWDSRDHRWFYLRPPDVADKLAADDPLHWTGIAQRWQTMCADCHSTNLKQNFDPASATYHTTFSEIDVSCEACHGPASLHVELANKKSLFWDRRHGYGLAKLKGADPEPQLQTCAPCHSRRGVMDPHFAAGPDYFDHYRLETLGEATYHGDGQIKDEVYVYGSFIQSKMYHKDIRCTDCHDPHSLKLKFPGNETCTNCHQHAAGKYDVPAHHHHAPGSEGAKCVNCHMPHTTYMDVDPRRDHSLRIPRPDLSVSLGTPNACSHCHVKDRLPQIATEHRDEFQSKEYSQWLLAAEQDGAATIGTDGETITELMRQTDRWCDDACEKWYGPTRKKPLHFAEALVPLRRGDPQAAKRAIEMLTLDDQRVPAIAKATLLDELARQGSRAAPRVAAELVGKSGQHPLVRSTAASVLAMADASTGKSKLMKLLSDESRLVRTSAARALLRSPAFGRLSSSERSQLEAVLNEVHEEFMAASDRAGAHMGWAGICEQLGRYGEAIEAYQTAIRVEPKAVGARTNFAALLEQIAPGVPDGERETLLRRVKTLRKQELPLLARDAALAPEIAGIQYRYGLLLYLDGQLDAALEQLEKAARLEPENQDFQTAVMLLKEKMDGAQ